MLFLIYFFIFEKPPGDEQIIQSNDFFTAENIRLKLPENLSPGWFLNSIDEQGTGIWGDVVSKRDKAFKVTYTNSGINVTDISRETGEKTERPEEVDLYFFIDLWSERDIKDYYARLSSKELLIRPVAYPRYLKQTSRFRIMYIGDDEEFIRYLNLSLKD